MASHCSTTFASSCFKYAQLHWWLWLELQHWPHKHVVRHSKKEGRGCTRGVHPLISCLRQRDGTRLQGPLQQALQELSNDDGLLISFDVWWAGRPSPAKGFLAQPSPQCFYDQVMSRLPPCACCFSQVLLPNASCCWYFDLDAPDPHYDLPRFLAALFEEAVTELAAHWGQQLTVQELWQHTLLLDASCATSGQRKKASCHGVVTQGLLVFPDNHRSMSAFTHNLLQRLQSRSDVDQLRTWDPKQQRNVLPLDASVYSSYRCFRCYGCVKMSSDRPLVLAPYNACRVQDASNKRSLFLQSLIEQRQPVTVVANPPAQQQRPPKKQRISRSPPCRVTECSAAAPASPALLSYLLRSVQSWGNAAARIHQVAPARCSDSTLYISFSNATHAWNHSHNSNNLYALVNTVSLTVSWHCFGKPCCRPRSVQLPRRVALQL